METRAVFRPRKTPGSTGRQKLVGTSWIPFILADGGHHDRCQQTPNEVCHISVSKMESRMSGTIRKQPAGKNPPTVTKRGQQLYLDFSFMSASADDYSRPDKTKDRTIKLYDGYSSYLLIVDEVSRYI